VDYTGSRDCGARELLFAANVPRFGAVSGSHTPWVRSGSPFLDALLNCRNWLQNTPLLEPVPSRSNPVATMLLHSCTIPLFRLEPDFRFHRSRRSTPRIGARFPPSLQRPWSVTTKARFPGAAMCRKLLQNGADFVAPENTFPAAPDAATAHSEKICFRAHFLLCAGGKSC